MTFNMTQIPSFGVAGNFTGHLEQAGEARDFANVKTAETNAPKAIFPTYIPVNLQSNNSCGAPDFLNVFPFDSEKIIYPAGEQKVQLEPECAIIFDAAWNETKLESLTPVAFGASNDCSIRKDGAKKISQKKNWGKSSKGFSDHLINIDNFAPGSILDHYRIASFMIRNGSVYDYGEDSAVRDYSYIYQKLIDWMLDKFNNQKDEGPAEDIHSYLVAAGCPKQIMVSIGATRYTEFGQTNFLQAGDESVVILYPENYSLEQIKDNLKTGAAFSDDISVLRQKIIL
ncbi:DUF5718 family protein [Treponema sp.]|uniref:DUF5718 family protein n=1 Tax=Treponema sp. TaxID=166 RepID=UPI00298E51AE|nr:DUF5718 family protein [Treponema sp.]MCR5612969.1 DUF5718 family protein [Treponema sp.]